MNDERVPWQAADLESAAVQVAGRPVHAMWSTLREHFRRVFLEPHRPAGSDKVGWRWQGASTPRAPESADLADLRQLLQHALLDLTADLERREQSPDSASPKELLAAVQTIIHDLVEGTDIDLGTYAVETTNGWFIRSWGFSHPAPAKLADETNATEPAEATKEPSAETPSSQDAPAEKPPAPKRRKLGRWAAGAVVLVGAAAALIWSRSCTQSTSNVSQPKVALGETPEATVPAAPHHEQTHAPHAPAQQHSVHGADATPTATALHGGPLTTAKVAPAHELSSAGIKAHSLGTPHSSPPAAQVGGMPELPGQTAKLAGDHPAGNGTDKSITPATVPSGSETDAAKTPAGGEGSADKHSPKPEAKSVDSQESNAHDSAPEAPKPTGNDPAPGHSADAPHSPTKDTPPPSDAVPIPEIPEQPAPAPVNPTPPAPPTPEAAAPESAEANPATAAAPPPPPVTSDHPADIVPLWVNKNAHPPTPPPPAPPSIFSPTAESPSEDNAATTPAPPPPPYSSANENASTHTETSESNENASPPAAGDPNDPTSPSNAKARAAAKAKNIAESITLTYQIGECKVRALRDTVLPTLPTEQSSRQMVADARDQAWVGSQAAKPESFRKPVVNGGWNFRPASGDTWTQHPIWLDTATGKPVDGVRVSANGLHLTWSGLVPAEGFSAHIIGDDDLELARLTYSAAERRFEVMTSPIFKESSPDFTVELTTREAVAGAMVWRSRTPTWSDARWETKSGKRQINVNCRQPLTSTKEPAAGVVALSHPTSGWTLTWEVSTRPNVTATKP